ncbi:integrator complex subunit 6 [Astatotilapia calliptera]|uniref:VWFA domain-containing protein n=1 Tax=Astatotilapia calliptera TaxID=8154 RepID=A0A3P8QP55_ASTCA|nr:integrator complex subunit 6 [Astatotilapia calliptera]XP_039890736.1 integrator complex subunit 6 [Simochromis diagramma]
MPVLLFLIDTSASMNQRTHLGTTYLDIAKGAVETFMKLRGRDPASRGDRYMLVNFEDVPFGIKAGWKESHATFMTELRNLQATGLTTIGQSLRNAFDLLNLNRLVTGIDNYGQGRNPFFLEPAIIIAITDGNKLTSSGGVQDELHLPLTTPLPGSELTKEPFRWDQRLFALVLRISGNASVEPEPLGGVPSDDSPITPMCEVTGGRSYSVFSQRMLNQCLESLVQKIQSGVVINFEKTGPDPPPLEDTPAEVVKSGPQPWHCCHKLIYVRPNPKTGVPIGHWPIPEAFWPDQNSPTLPPRSAHPHVRFSCVDAEPMVIDKVPFDKYELEPSPLTQYILERKSPHTCWQVFVCNSAKYSDLGQPFGYLKASTALNCVNLFVMPYNYPVLLPLLDDLIKVHKFKPTIKWRQSFENYLKTMPPYYIGSLRKALRIMGAPNLLADNLEYGLSYSVVSYLKKLSQQTKIEYDRLIALIGKKQPPEPGLKVRWRGGSISLAQRRDFIQQLQNLTGEAPALPMELNPKEFQGFHLALLNKSLKPQSFRNPYDIPRSHLLDQLSRMRRNLLNTSVCTVRGHDSDQLHSVPIAQMGNYQDFLKAAPQPLRDADPEQPKRLHTFGNPFKLDKKGMMIDEADEFVTGPQNKGKRPGDSNNVPGGGPKRRRCMSPLLRLGRAYTPPVSPSASPRHSADMDVNDGAPEADLIINHVDQNHYGSDRNSDSEVDRPSSPTDLQENHTAADPQAMRHRDEDENGQTHPSELPLGSEGGAEMVLMDDQVQHYITPSALKKHIHTETTKVNNELRSLITKEIRKPGRHYEKIFLLLKQIQGTLDTRLIFLQNIIKEAARFKKRVLIEQLENFLEEIHNRATNMNHVDTF